MVARGNSWRTYLVASEARGQERVRSFAAANLFVHKTTRPNPSQPLKDSLAQLSCRWLHHLVHRCHDWPSAKRLRGSGRANTDRCVLSSQLRAQRCEEQLLIFLCTDR